MFSVHRYAVKWGYYSLLPYISPRSCEVSFISNGRHVKNRHVTHLQVYAGPWALFRSFGEQVPSLTQNYDVLISLDKTS